MAHTLSVCVCVCVCGGGGGASMTKLGCFCDLIQGEMKEVQPVVYYHNQTEPSTWWGSWRSFCWVSLYLHSFLNFKETSDWFL